jgi:hypothetical protein
MAACRARPASRIGRSRPKPKVYLAAGAAYGHGRNRRTRSSANRGGCARRGRLPAVAPACRPRAAPDGAHTHGSGGSGLGTAVLVVVGAALAVKLAGPVLGAVGALVHVLLIAAAIILGVGAVGLLAFVAYRVRHGGSRRTGQGPGGAPASPGGGAARTGALRAAPRDRVLARGTPAPARRERRGRGRHPCPPDQL